jgi:hypothetical protein
MSFDFLDITPVALTDIEDDEVLGFDVRSTDPFGLITVAAKFPRSVTRELVFCADPSISTVFEEAYASSTITPVVDGAYVRWQFRIRRDPRWPGNPTLTVISEGGSGVVGPAGPTGPAGARGGVGRPGSKGEQGRRGRTGRVTPQRIPDQRVMGNDSDGTYPAYPITVHQELDWILSVTTKWLFDGVDDDANIGSVLNYERTNSFSISAWITTDFNTSYAQTDVIIVGKNQVSADHRGYDFYIHDDGFLHFKLINTHNTNDLDVSIQTGGAATNDGLRHHVVATYSGGSNPVSVQIYVDGVVQPKTTVLNSLTQTIVGTGALRIGSFGSTNSAYFPGLIEHVSFWDVALTGGNVTTLFNGGTPGNLALVSFVANLDAWYKFDATDTTAPSGILDYGPSGFHATAQNGLGTFTGKGLLPVRSTSTWTTITPSFAGRPLISQGLGFLPTFDLLTDTGLSPTAAISISKLAAQPTNTVLANATNATAVMTAFPLATNTVLLRAGGDIVAQSVGTNTVLGRVAGNIVAAALVNAQVDAAAGIVLSKLATQGANTVVVNATAGTAVPTALTIGTNSVLGRVAGNIVAAALADAQIATNTISAASQAQMGANTIKANATAGTANEANLAVGTNTVVGRVAGNIVAASLVDAQITTNTISNASRTQMAANTIKANATAGTANEADFSIGTNTVLGRVGANIVAAALVDAQVDAAAGIQLSKLAAQGANTVVLNATAGSAVPTAFAIGTNSVLGRVAGNIVAAALVDAQVSATAAIALTKLADGTANSLVGNWTAGSAAHTDNTVGTNTVVGRVAGNIVAAALVNAQVDAAAAIVLSKLANATANTITGNWTNGSAAHTDNSVGANTVVGRVAGDIVAAALVNAQVDAAAAIAISKLANAAANTLTGNWTNGAAAHTDNSVGTNTVVGRVAGDIVAAALVNAQVDAAAAIVLSKLADGAALSVVGRSVNSGGAHADITAGAGSDAVLRESGSTVGFGTVAAGGLASAIISPVKLALLASDIGTVFTLYKAFAAGAGGAPDDVTVYSANAPFAFRILKTLPYITTAVSTFTIQARDTAGGGGAALSSEFDAGLATEDPAIVTPITATTSVAASGTLVIRRGDSGIAGEFVFVCVRV